MFNCVAKIYYEQAKKMYPQETDHKRLFGIAVQLKLMANSIYGNPKMIQ